MATREEKHEAEVEPDVVSETYEVLRSLGHSESEARRLLDAALSSKKKFKDVQSMIEAVYQQSQH
jgi:Holliday junction DNA helicase RuvA